MKSSENRYALLIDADNVSARYIKPILDELSKYGNVTYKRIYGDWTNTRNAGWKEVLLQNSISPIQQYSYTQGKNATDSAMIIDAMDILYTGKVEGFCIVSSDSDFTRLASRLRESGQNVIGMGEQKTPTAFRQACNIFTILELLLEDEEEAEEKTDEKEEAGSGKPDAQPELKSRMAGKAQPSQQKQKGAAEKSSITRDYIEEAVIKIIIENQNNGKDTELGEVGSRLVKLYPDFDVRSYGYSMLHKFLETFPKLMIIRQNSRIFVTLYEDPGRTEDLEKFIVEEVKNSGSAGLLLGVLGQRIHSRFRDFQVRDFGYSQLKNYIGSLPCIHIEGEGNQMVAIYEAEAPEAEEETDTAHVTAHPKRKTGRKAKQRGKTKRPGNKSR